MSAICIKKVITTPHIMQDYYPNTPDIINAKLNEVQEAIKIAKLDIQLTAAAEYYLDDVFLKMVRSGADLLTLHDKYLLFETSFQDKPLFLQEAIFEMQSKGFLPVLAHPERYRYLETDWNLTCQLKNSGVYFQLNSISLSGYYSRESKKFAEKLIDHGMIDFIGSDCHGMRHIDALKMTMKKSRYWKKVMALPLKNNELI